jgi:phytoene synthase
LPREDLERFDGELELVIAFEAQRGLEWLERGLGLIPLLDRRSTAAVLAMAGKYRVLLERIAHEPGIVLNGHRLSLRPWEKGLVLARSLAGVSG